MSTKRLSRLYTAITVLDEPLFWGPVLLQALAHNAGLNQREIFISEAWAIALVILLDTPLGALADQIGRKKCVLIGKTIGVFIVILLAVMNEPWHAYTAQALWALEVGLVGGAESAMARDTYSARGETHIYDELMARILTIKFAVSAVAAIVAGLMAGYNLYLPMILSVPGVVISYILTFYFPEVEVAKKKKAHIHLAHGIRELKNNTTLRNCFLLIAVYMAISKAFFFTFNPYMEKGGLPMSVVGMVMTATMILAAIGSRYSIRLSKLRMSHCLIAMGLLHLVASSTPACIGVVMFALQGLVRGYANWWSQKTAQDLIESDESRATLLSLKSTITQVASLAVFAFMSPFASDTRSALLVLSLVSLCIGVYSLIKKR